MSELKKAAKEITQYLEGFKDTEGNQPDQFKVAVMVQVYCDEHYKTITK